MLLAQTIGSTNDSPEPYTIDMGLDALVVGAVSVLSAWLAAPDANLLKAFGAGALVAFVFIAAHRKLNTPKSV